MCFSAARHEMISDASLLKRSAYQRLVYSRTLESGSESTCAKMRYNMDCETETPDLQTTEMASETGATLQQQLIPDWRHSWTVSIDH